MANTTRGAGTVVTDQVNSSPRKLVGEQIRQMKSPPGLFRRASVRTMQYVPSTSSWERFLKELQAVERETEEQLARLKNIRKGNYYGQQNEKEEEQKKNNMFAIDDPVSRRRKLSEFEGTFLSSGVDLAGAYIPPGMAPLSHSVSESPMDEQAKTANMEHIIRGEAQHQRDQLETRLELPCYPLDCSHNQWAVFRLWPFILPDAKNNNNQFSDVTATDQPASDEAGPGKDLPTDATHRGVSTAKRLLSQMFARAQKRNFTHPATHGYLARQSKAQTEAGRAEQQHAMQKAKASLRRLLDAGELDLATVCKAAAEMTDINAIGQSAVVDLVCWCLGAQLRSLKASNMAGDGSLGTASKVPAQSTGQSQRHRLTATLKLVQHLLEDTQWGRPAFVRHDAGVQVVMCILKRLWFWDDVMAVAIDVCSTLLDHPGGQLDLKMTRQGVMETVVGGYMRAETKAASALFAGFLRRLLQKQCARTVGFSSQSIHVQLQTFLQRQRERDLQRSAPAIYTGTPRNTRRGMLSESVRTGLELMEVFAGLCEYAGSFREKRLRQMWIRPLTAATLGVVHNSSGSGANAVMWGGFSAGVRADLREAVRGLAAFLARARTQYPLKALARSGIAHALCGCVALSLGADRTCTKSALQLLLRTFHKCFKLHACSVVVEQLLATLVPLTAVLYLEDVLEDNDDDASVGSEGAKAAAVAATASKTRREILWLAHQLLRHLSAALAGNVTLPQPTPYPGGDEEEQTEDDDEMSEPNGGGLARLRRGSVSSVASTMLFASLPMTPRGGDDGDGGGGGGSGSDDDDDAQLDTRKLLRRARKTATDIARDEAPPGNLALTVVDLLEGWCRANWQAAVDFAGASRTHGNFLLGKMDDVVWCFRSLQSTFIVCGMSFCQQPRQRDALATPLLQVIGAFRRLFLDRAHDKKGKELCRALVHEGVRRRLAAVGEDLRNQQQLQYRQRMVSKVDSEYKQPAALGFDVGLTMTVTRAAERLFAQRRNTIESQHTEVLESSSEPDEADDHGSGHRSNPPTYLGPSHRSTPPTYLGPSPTSEQPKKLRNDGDSGHQDNDDPSDNRGKPTTFAGGKFSTPSKALTTRSARRGPTTQPPALPPQEASFFRLAWTAFAHYSLSSGVPGKGKHRLCARGFLLFLRECGAVAEDKKRQYRYKLGPQQQHQQRRRARSGAVSSMWLRAYYRLPTDVPSAAPDLDQTLPVCDAALTKAEGQRVYDKAVTRTQLTRDASGDRGSACPRMHILHFLHALALVARLLLSRSGAVVDEKGDADEERALCRRMLERSCLRTRAATLLGLRGTEATLEDVQVMVSNTQTNLLHIELKQHPDLADAVHTLGPSLEKIYEYFRCVTVANGKPTPHLGLTPQAGQFGYSNFMQFASAVRLKQLFSIRVLAMAFVQCAEIDLGTLAAYEPSAAEPVPHQPRRTLLSRKQPVQSSEVPEPHLSLGGFISCTLRLARCLVAQRRAGERSGYAKTRQRVSATRTRTRRKLKSDRAYPGGVTAVTSDPGVKSERAYPGVTAVASHDPSETLLNAWMGLLSHMWVVLTQERPLRRATGGQTVKLPSSHTNSGWPPHLPVSLAHHTPTTTRHKHKSLESMYGLGSPDSIERNYSYGFVGAGNWRTQPFVPFINAFHAEWRRKGFKKYLSEF